MIIIYRDEVGYITEQVDEYGVSFYNGKAVFNDKEVDIFLVDSITEIKD